MNRRRRAWAALLGGCGLAGCGRDAALFPWRERPNVLLVVVDTLRKDHLQPYGYAERPTTPALSAFAGQALLVDGLTCVSSWTMPSMATLFTGLRPDQHGVMRMTGSNSVLRDARTLAAELRNAGYATGCVMSNFLLARSRGVGFDSGFDWYDDEIARRPEPHRGSSAAEVAERGLAWLAGQEGGRPWFLVLHFFDPHVSYEDHPAYSFADPDYRGWVQGGLPYNDYRDHAASCSAADRRQLAAYYDEEIRAVDEAFARVMAAVDLRGDASRTLVAFTADHGEELAERGHIGHTRTLHFEQIDLPLLLRFPGGHRAGERAELAPFSQTHLYATLLEWCGVAAAPGRGASLAPILAGGAAPAAGLPPASAAAEVDFVPLQGEHGEKYVSQRAVLAEGYKLIHDLKTGRFELYDLAADAREARDLAGAAGQAARLSRLRALLEQSSWWEAP